MLRKRQTWSSQPGYYRNFHFRLPFAISLLKSEAPNLRPNTQPEMVGSWIWIAGTKNSEQHFVACSLCCHWCSCSIWSWCKTQEKMTSQRIILKFFIWAWSSTSSRDMAHVEGAVLADIAGTLAIWAGMVGPRIVDNILLHVVIENNGLNNNHVATFKTAEIQWWKDKQNEDETSRRPRLQSRHAQLNDGHGTGQAAPMPKEDTARMGLSMAMMLADDLKC